MSDNITEIETAEGTLYIDTDTLESTLIERKSSSLESVGGVDLACVETEAGRVYIDPETGQSALVSDDPIDPDAANIVDTTVVE